MTEDWSQGDDEWWLASMADHIEEAPAALADASPAQLRRAPLRSLPPEALHLAGVAHLRVGDRAREKNSPPGN